jgi:hypothetical protein
MNLMMTSTLHDRLRRASALTGLEPAEMVRCAVSEWLQRLEQPPLPFSASVAAPPRAESSPSPAAPEPTPEPTQGNLEPASPPAAAVKKRGRRRRSAGKEES